MIFSLVWSRKRLPRDNFIEHKTAKIYRHRNLISLRSTHPKTSPTLPNKVSRPTSVAVSKIRACRPGRSPASRGRARTFLVFFILTRGPLKPYQDRRLPAGTDCIVQKYIPIVLNTNIKTLHSKCQDGSECDGDGDGRMKLHCCPLSRFLRAAKPPSVVLDPRLALRRV